ncbi:ANTAR domain-containing protein [Streptomyces sp. NPDC053542]|uniref:ANTAR domain-containing protein n=1 Tax=Streptomyces sp. NPDC053542 TaxID=3365710 RepID=UPI0037CFDE8B
MDDHTRQQVHSRAGHAEVFHGDEVLVSREVMRRACECCVGLLKTSVAIAVLGEGGRALWGAAASDGAGSLLDSVRGPRPTGAIDFPLQLDGDADAVLRVLPAAGQTPAAQQAAWLRPLGDLIAVLLRQERELRRCQRTVAQLTCALDSRVLIEQAKGVLADRWGVTPEQAFHSLRAYARSHNAKLHTVAEDVVHRQLQVDHVRPGAVALSSTETPTCQ